MSKLNRSVDLEFGIGFWFGMETPKNDECKVFTYDFSSNDLYNEFEEFKKDYEIFKLKNINPTIPYKNSLLEEECIIFYEDNQKFTTFEELYLLITKLSEVDNKILEIENEINNLESQQFNFVDNVFNKVEEQIESEMVNITDIFTKEEINTIFKIYDNNKSNYNKFQKSLKKYFSKIKHSLSKRGFDNNYLSYVVSHNIFKNNQ